jgi:hypothetical protein
VLVQRGNSKQRLVVKSLSSFAVMISFGALFPMLGLILAISIYVNTVIEQLNTEALLKQSFTLKYPIYSIKLTQECKEFCSSFKANIRYSIGLTSLLLGYIAFDALGDKFDWVLALIPAILIYLFQLITQTCIRFAHNYARLSEKRALQTTTTTTMRQNRVGDKPVVEPSMTHAVNPMHP